MRFASRGKKLTDEVPGQSVNESPAPLRLLADESCDYRLIRALRTAGHDVIAIAEAHAGVDDEKVIELARSEQRLLIAEDKDFGRLVFLSAKANAGVVLVRYPVVAHAHAVEAVLTLLAERGNDLYRCFVVIEPGRIRVSKKLLKQIRHAVSTFPRPALFTSVTPSQLRMTGTSPRKWGNKTLQILGVHLMRISLAMAVACLSMGISIADEAHAAIKKDTIIPAQGLGPALKQLASERDVQLVYRSEIVGNMQTNGAVGELTLDQTLTKLLDGTGLTYQYIDDRAITIVPMDSRSSPTQASVPSPQSSTDGVWSRFRLAQAENPANTPARRTSDPQGKVELEEIIVTGQRMALQAAADIKKNADQVVDSLVAQDIGKFPDATVAAALQRIPGVQVFYSNKNEATTPIVRGLPDVLTTIDGREVFTGVNRAFSFEDLPAEVLGGADVYKSNTANLIEGGVAGVINLKLRKPLDLEEGTTIAGQVRGIYGEEVDDNSFTTSGMVSRRWAADSGEYGALFGASFQDYNFSRKIGFAIDPIGVTLSGASVGAVVPSGFNSTDQNGWYTRPQANFAFQWKPAAMPSVELYAEGLYAGHKAEHDDVSMQYIYSPSAVTAVDATDDCGDYRVGANGRYSAAAPLGRYCIGSSLTTGGTGRNFTARAFEERDTRSAAGGIKYDSGPVHAGLDFSWMRSWTTTETYSFGIDKPVGSFTAVFDVDDATSTVGAGRPLASPDGYVISFPDIEVLSRNDGDLKAVAADGRYDFGGFIRDLQAGVRLADRQAQTQGATVVRFLPSGADPLVANNNMGSDFLTRHSLSGIDNEAEVVVVSPDWIESNRQRMRQLVGAPATRPEYQPQRGFDIGEKTSSAYLQTKYGAQLSNAVSIDGLLGVRYTKTDRDLTGTGIVNSGGVASPVTVDRSTSDSDVLPNASFRLQLGDNWQVRAAYSRTIARPAFASLNPGLNYTVTTGGLFTTASGGNPDLKPQQSDGVDVSVEYYLGQKGYLAATVYQKDLSDRVITNVAFEEINGQVYSVFRPRNVASAELKGLELGGQMFFDNLPGVFGGLGAFANYTLADSEITTRSDPLFGYNLTGVSKNSYNVGLLFEKYGLSARAVYTHRSAYNAFDATFSGGVHPEGVIYFVRERAIGRLDASLGYDLTEHVTLTLEGLNLTGYHSGNYVSYASALPRDYRLDERSYIFGVRAKF